MEISNYLSEIFELQDIQVKGEQRVLKKVLQL